LVALSAGVAAFELLGPESASAQISIVPSQRPRELLVQAMRHAERVTPGGVAAERAAAAALTPAEPVALAPAVTLPTAPRPAFEVSDAAVRAEARELRAEPPALQSGDQVEVTISFYYCEEGPEDFPAGDGGGFCGLMRDGTRVYPGAAACAREYLGQIFRIIGDPTERIYKCADTGSLIDGLHRDIWFRTNDAGWLWQQHVGPLAVIEILP
jgi:hypothetical protein